LPHRSLKTALSNLQNDVAHNWPPNVRNFPPEACFFRSNLPPQSEALSWRRFLPLMLFFPFRSLQPPGTPKSLPIESSCNVLFERFCNPFGKIASPQPKDHDSRFLCPGPFPYFSFETAPAFFAGLTYIILVLFPVGEGLQLNIFFLIQETTLPCTAFLSPSLYNK